MIDSHKKDGWGVTVFKNEEIVKNKAFVSPFPEYQDILGSQFECLAVLGEGFVRLACRCLHPLLLVADLDKKDYEVIEIFNSNAFPGKTSGLHDEAKKISFKWSFWYTAENDIIILNMEAWCFEKGTLWEAKVGFGYGK